MASYIKQLIFFFLIAQLIFPIGLPAGNLAQILSWVLWYLVRIGIIAVIVALTEVSLAKMRLFRVAVFWGLLLYWE